MKNYIPTWCLKGVYQLTPDMLKKQGINGVLIDLDNTLIGWNVKHAPAHCLSWITQMREAGIPVVIVSNNSTTRVKQALQPLDVPIVAYAKKPLRFGLERALERIALTKDEVVMIGDQLLTDVLAANRFGMRSIFVKSCVDSDSLMTSINRIFERRIIARLERTGAMPHWSDSL